jgi:hypothetical protein
LRCSDSRKCCRWTLPGASGGSVLELHWPFHVIVKPNHSVQHHRRSHAIDLLTAGTLYCAPGLSTPLACNCQRSQRHRCNRHIAASSRRKRWLRAGATLAVSCYCQTQPFSSAPSTLTCDRSSYSWHVKLCSRIVHSISVQLPEVTAPSLQSPHCSIISPRCCVLRKFKNF